MRRRDYAQYGADFTVDDAGSRLTGRLFHASVVCSLHHRARTADPRLRDRRCRPTVSREREVFHKKNERAENAAGIFPDAPCDSTSMSSPTDTFLQKGRKPWRSKR